METYKVKRKLKRALLFSLAFIYDQYQKVSIKNFYRMLYLPGYNGNKKSFYQLLSRSEKIGDITKETKNGEVYIKLSSKAGNFFDEKISLKKISEMSWDGFWRLVIFDISETDKAIREKLRKKLRQLGFTMWQESVYITPHPITDEINEYLKSNNLFPKVICLEAKTIGVENQKGFAWIIFNLKNLQKKYLALINLFNHVIKDYKERKIRKKEFLKKIQEIFQNYQELILDDPFLPKGLEPDDWPREKLRKKFLKITEELIEK